LEKIKNEFVAMIRVMGNGGVSLIEFVYDRTISIPALQKSRDEKRWLWAHNAFFPFPPGFLYYVMKNGIKKYQTVEETEESAGFPAES